MGLLMIRVEVTESTVRLWVGGCWCEAEGQLAA